MMRERTVNLEEKRNKSVVFGEGLVGSLAVVGLIYLLVPIFFPALVVAFEAEKLAWYLSRSAAVVSYLLIAGSTVWGLLLSSRIVKENVAPPFSLAMHQFLSWGGISAAGVHAFLLLFDRYFDYSWGSILLPFTGPYRPLAVGLGTVSFYILLLVAVSFYWRKQIGQKSWRRLHYLSFLSYILMTVHGVMAGTDQLWLQPIFYGSGAVVFFLTAYRIVVSVRGRSQ